MAAAMVLRVAGAEDPWDRQGDRYDMEASCYGV